MKLKQGILPMALNSILMAPCLRAGRVLEELDLKASFALGTFATVFQAEVYAIMACSDYCLTECMTGKTTLVKKSGFGLLFTVYVQQKIAKVLLHCNCLTNYN
jgi:hypothetical protein